MVTMSTEAAESYELVKGLIDAGMDVMRVNCAHDSAPAWERMIAHMRRANKESGKQCRVVMDLAGPKLRTGPLHRGNHVVRWKVSKSARGLVTTPARVILTSRQAQRESLPPSDAMLPVPETLLREARPGDVIRIDDSRGRHRRLTVTEKAAHHCVCACEQSAFILSHAKLSLLREGEKVATGRVGELPFIEEPITLHQHDLLILTRDDGDDHAAARTRRSDRSRNRSRNPPRISCTLPEVFDTAQPGQPIFFDDGKIEGRIRDVQPDGILVEIAHTAPGGSKLGSAKGINLPETDLGIAAMTEKDRQDLDFIAAHADIVGLSFTRRPEDVLELRQELTARNGGHLGIVLKIESGQGFDQLPLIMMAALGHHPVGIMVARGDLAIEVGFERLAELQEEILWLSEAAHMPVIWATQVLETLAKTGVPSRAEVTDAAMGVRAECVMLNKGEHIVEAARFLDHILHKMRAHQIKKRSMLRRLTVAQVNAQPPAAASPVKTHSGIVETSSVQPHG
jgi:pyruvate kinase